MNSNEKHERILTTTRGSSIVTQITLVMLSVINYDNPSGPLGLCLGCNVGQGKEYNEGKGTIISIKKVKKRPHSILIDS